MKKTSLFFLGLIIISGTLPAFAEVSQMNLDKYEYTKDEYLNITGKVSEDSSGLVSIVVRNPHNEFVLLSQAIIRGDNSFEKVIPINQKFSMMGEYNVTAFVLNMTEAKTQSFFILEKLELGEIHSDYTEEDFLDTDPLITGDAPSTLKDFASTTNESQITEENQVARYSTVADFVDKSRDPQYYIDRYYNEPNYKSWFDRNYPEITIEDAVGYSKSSAFQKDQFNIAKKEFIQEAEASSIFSNPDTLINNSDLAHTGLAIGGLVILFCAVYGIKRKIDNNSRHISINTDIIKKKILSPIVNSNPFEIIQIRLAKGEITIEEYDKLKERLGINSK